MGFFTGDEGGYEQVSRLEKGQQPIKNQLYNASKGQRGAGGAYGTLADYYYDLFNDDSETFNAMARPEMRRFNEQIIPGLSEQFAGMGAGGLSSSGFRNAGVSAATDLSERLGSMRANLRQQGAQGLMNLGNQSLSSFSENVYNKGSPGFLDSVAPLAGAAIGAFAGGPAGAAAGYQTGGWLSGSSKGKSSPYGGKGQMPGGNTSGNWNLPTFMGK